MSADQISKVQERETLEEIMALIQNIGGGASYIGMAMKGVYDVAISNIENDFGDSLAERLESANTRAAKCAMDADNYKEEAKEASKWAEESKQLHKEAVETVFSIQKELDRERASLEEYIQSEQMAQRRAETMEADLHFAKQEIIELKAKLYDLVIKEEG